ncbi:sigma-70 family RNA polymerase sigma factor [Chitinophaga sancti]|uniref:RNA polymerase sigma factor n=1 Tax=Chitinophaga sancti TaxID=1004 RepID=UPI002A7588C6|nr:sigma-70 family RNA polymerase sigma factor [Chitinophaga sancti]WPQ63372.1 sigma-70 family RNA polymerase sigma factor [Chitinophaga sancti]
MLYKQDEELLREIQQGNEATFADVYNHYQPLLLLEAYYKIRSYPEAEDMVQEIFTSLWQRRKELSLSIPLKHYLFKAVHLQYAYKCRKSEVARKFIQHTLYVSREAATNYVLENKEIYRQIKEAIASVSAPATRRAFELLYIEDKSHKEIAVDMNIQPQVVKNQVSRALKIIRSHLKKVI